MFNHVQKSISLCLVLGLVITGGLAGCASSGGASGDPADIVGTWNYQVSGLDVLDLRNGTIQIVDDNGALQGAFDAAHLDMLPLRNIRYRGGELTFLVQAFPGQPQGVAFSLDPSGNSMSGIAYPAEDAASIEVGSRPGADMSSVEIRATRVQ